jgi:FkbM family methyltransferase
MILSYRQFVQVPIMMECFGLFFDTLYTQSSGAHEVLDFSQPALHRYRRSDVSFYFPGIPEDDVMDAYTHRYTPSPGDVVWDAGAHAGATAYFLSQMVGPAGRVYAFEPDRANYEYLLRNIEMNGLRNVVPVAKALSGETGTSTFLMDGTMAAGLNQYLVYSGAGELKEVPTLTIADGCQELGSVPQYIKMDIEGAEVAAIEGSAGFLRDHPIHFAIESYHRIGGEYTFKALERIFPKIGYTVESSAEFGQMFTWAHLGLPH